MFQPRILKLLIVVLSVTIIFFIVENFVYKSDEEPELPEWEQDQLDLQKANFNGNKAKIFENWRKCAEENWLGLEDERKFWNSFTEVSKYCDKEAEVANLGVVTIRNRDDRKHFIFPKNTSRSTNLVTIGIGEDISAELHFQRKHKKLGKSINFYGADPMTSVNAKLYSKIGQYFPYAVSMENGISTASVLLNNKYVDRSVEHKNIIDFVKNDLKINKIDNLWIDAEFAEYDLFQIFEKNSKFSQTGIEICQVNIEVHLNQFERLEQNADYQYRFMRFVKKIVNDGKFGLFKATEALHLRIFMFNFQSDYCREKF